MANHVKACPLKPKSNRVKHIPALCRARALPVRRSYVWRCDTPQPVTSPKRFRRRCMPPSAPSRCPVFLKNSKIKRKKERRLRESRRCRQIRARRTLELCARLRHLTMRLSDARLCQHQTKTLNSNHQLSPSPVQDAAPRSLRLLEAWP
jgi:hypothetical protein